LSNGGALGGGDAVLLGVVGLDKLCFAVSRRDLNTDILKNLGLRISYRDCPPFVGGVVRCLSDPTMMTNDFDRMRKFDSLSDCADPI